MSGESQSCGVVKSSTLTMTEALWDGQCILQGADQGTDQSPLLWSGEAVLSSPSDKATSSRALSSGPHLWLGSAVFPQCSVEATGQGLGGGTLCMCWLELESSWKQPQDFGLLLEPCYSGSARSEAVGTFPL